MFLNAVMSLILSWGASSVVAVAGNASADFPGLEPGHYRLTEGSDQLCRSFSIEASAIKSRRLEVGGRYTMILRNARRQVESDLDPNCEFVEEATKESSDVDTVMTRANSEICGGVTKSKTVSKFLFRGEKIWLDHAIQEGPRNVSYRCVWTRAN